MFKHQAIYDDIQSKIMTNVYLEGMKLPSIAALSQTYQCNKATVIRALEHLKQSNLIYSVNKSGYYVLKKAFTHIEEDGLLHFSSSMPNQKFFPYLDFQSCINQAIDFYKQDLFVYGNPKGFSPLITSIKNLLESYQVFSQESNIHIISGAQQAIYILSSMPFPNGKNKILIEQPTYHVICDLLDSRPESTAYIKRGPEGIDLSELERVFKEDDIKFFYLTPRFHSPLGVSLSKQEKLDLLKLAEKYNVYIVEDDYLADFDPQPKNDPLYSYDMHNRVIYIKSFSKVIFPGIRLAAIVIPTDFNDTFDSHKKLIDLHSSLLSQSALEVYLNSGLFLKNKIKLMKSYESLSLTLNRAIAENPVNDEIKVYYDFKNSIFKAAYLLPREYKTNKIIGRLKDKGIVIESADDDFLSSIRSENIIKIDVSSIERDKIMGGLKEIVNEMNCGFK